jgi:hypothetical protein
MLVAWRSPRLIPPCVGLSATFPMKLPAASGCALREHDLVAKLF